ADRYRLATWPVVCLCAAVGLWRVVREVTRYRAEGRGKERSGWIGVCIVISLVLAHGPIDPVTSEQTAWCRHVEGNLAFMNDDLESAEALYAQAVKLDPDDLGAWSWLARCQDQDDREAEAVVSMNKVVDVFSDHYPSLLYLSQLHSKLGNSRTAAEFAGRAYRVPGPRTNTGVRYVKLLVGSGQLEKAREVVADDPKLQGHPKLEGVLKE
ncbi:MAG: tetratricopeptide repeat protein, partial [Myxococcota bacterium]|nr:tetratricopeptide repeat protein [Myxococcota bacterium]